MSAVRAAQPDLIICPFLKHRVPSQVWQNRRTIDRPPGPRWRPWPVVAGLGGHRGRPCWGVTALQAAEEMDAGDVWATRNPMPVAPPAKRALYSGAVADAAVECIHETVREGRRTRPSTPTPDRRPAVEVPGARLRPALRQPDRAFDWADAAEHIVRRVRAADGSPGVPTGVCGLSVYAYDAHHWVPPAGRARRVASRRHGAVLVGHAPDGASGSATRGRRAERRRAGHQAAGDHGALEAGGAECRSRPLGPGPTRNTTTGRSGTCARARSAVSASTSTTARCRPGSADGCRRRCGMRPPRTPGAGAAGSTEAFTNGIHLNVTEAPPNPAAAAWPNLRAIDEACRQLLTSTRQVVVTAFAGNAGAGG